jgi:hypothetical protein
MSMATGGISYSYSFYASSGIGGIMHAPTVHQLVITHNSSSITVVLSIVVL